MVLKKSKHGGNTGNTLRKVSNVGKGEYNSISYIKTISGNKKKVPFAVKQQPCREDWLKDNNLSFKTENSLNQNASHVQFSCSKNKRWELCDSIDNQIRNHKAETLFEDSAKHESIALVVKPWHSNNDKLVKLFADSNKKEINGKWKSQMRIIADYDKMYVIENAVPSKTFPYINKIPKHTYEYDKQSYCRHRFKENLRRFADDFEDCENDFYINTPVEDRNLHCSLETEFPLHEFIKTSRKKSRTTKKNANKLLDDIFHSKQNHLHYIEDDILFLSNYNESFHEMGSITRNDPIIAQVDSSAQVDGADSSECQTFTIKVDKTNIEHSVLQNKYKSSYIEGKSIPRCFTIYNYKDSNVKVFIEVANVEESFACLLIKIFSTDSIDCVDDLSDCSSVDFDCIIEMICPILKTKSNNNKISVNTSTNLPSKSFLTTVEMEDIVLNQMNTTEKNFEEKIIINDSENTPTVEQNIENTSTVEQNIENTPTVEKNYDISYSVVCSVCLEEGSSTVLLGCNHVFCDNCWQRYIETKIYLGNEKLSCLALECESHIDIATAMKFMNKKTFLIYQKLICNAFILKNQSKACPNPKCEKIAMPVHTNIIQPSSSSLHKNIPIVNCGCTKSWCFNCQLGDHWPVSCEVWKQYAKQMNQDINVLFDRNGRFFQTELNCRRCPFCKTHIEKNGGCPSMVCFCGRIFCWTCLQEHHSFTGKCEEKSDEQINFSSMDDINLNASREIKVFRNALKYKIAVNNIVKLHTKLKINKIKTSMVISFPEKSLLNTVEKATALLIECYKLMENLSLVFAKRKYSRGSIRDFLDSLYLFTSLLYDEIHIKTLMSLRINKVENYSNVIRILLQKLGDM